MIADVGLLSFASVRS